jgi:hypothetical protein
MVIKSYQNSISVKLMDKDAKFSFSMVHIYGPYVDRVPFWEDLSLLGSFSGPFMVVGGDLNFTLSLYEIWGENPRQDNQMGFFVSFMHSHKLVYIEPIKLVPTWHNFIIYEDVVSKILDHFFILEALLETSFLFKSSIV